MSDAERIEKLIADAINPDARRRNITKLLALGRSLAEIEQHYANPPSRRVGK